MNVKRLDYIDSLRGVAILMVIAVHTSQSIENLPQTLLGSIANFGQMGVQLFFILSAISLCMSMERSEMNNENLLVFYIKRYFRIAPLYYLGILIYYFVSFFNNLVTKRHVFEAGDQYTLTNVLSNIFFIHGFVPSAYNNVVPGGWSIGTEMAFYAIFPFLFLLYDKKKFYISVLYILLTISVCYSLVILLEDNFDKWFLYFNLVNMLPVFILGIFYYIFLKNFNKTCILRSKYLTIFITIFLLVISYISFTYYHNIIFTPLLGALCFIFLIDLFKHFDNLNNYILVKIGQLSFSIYLFHFIFAHQFSKGIDLILKEKLNPSIIYFICFFMTIILTYLIAYESEKLIEKPGINFGKYLIKNLRNRSDN